MMFGHVIASDHSIKRYKERILSRKSEVKDDSRSAIIKMILRDVSYRNIKEINSWKDFSNFVFSYLNLELKLSFNSLEDFKEYVCNNELQMKLELNYILTLINIQPPLGIDDEDFKDLGFTSILSF